MRASGVVAAFANRGRRPSGQKNRQECLFGAHTGMSMFRRMPELAEVEYFRRRWNIGIGQWVTRVALHARKRVFRGTDTRALCQHLTLAQLLSSEARGKRMLFRFSNENWLGLHLGMTGRMRTMRPDFRPEKHDHLVLYQREQALVFTDARQFGRVQFHHGEIAPGWWENGVPEIVSEKFDRAFLDRFAAPSPDLLRYIGLTPNSSLYGSALAARPLPP